MIVRSLKPSSATNLSPSSTSPTPNVADRLIYKGSYAYKTITRANRALAASLKLSLRIDSEGLLSLQFMLPPSRPNDEVHAFIEFKVCLVVAGILKRVLFMNHESSAWLGGRVYDIQNSRKNHQSNRV